jgi:hypothetical protein
MRDDQLFHADWVAHCAMRRYCVAIALGGSASTSTIGEAVGRFEDWCAAESDVEYLLGGLGRGQIVRWSLDDRRLPNDVRVERPP